MGLHGIPMGNMSNQQLMQMQLHGMDLQRMGMGLPGLFPHCDSTCQYMAAYKQNCHSSRIQSCTGRIQCIRAHCVRAFLAALCNMSLLQLETAP